MSSTEPIYASRSTLTNLGQRYLVYPDRVELHLRLGRKMIIPVEHILVVDRRDKALMASTTVRQPTTSSVVRPSTSLTSSVPGSAT